MGRRAGLALAHQNPARIAQHDLVALVAADRADIDDAGIARRGLLQPDHLRGRRERVARIDRLEEAPIGIAEIGDGIERNVRHRLAEDDVKDEQVVDRRRGIADRAGEGVRGLHGETRAVERRIERRIPGPHRARRRMDDGVAEVEILEEAAGTGLRARAGHASPPDRRQVCVATKGHVQPRRTIERFVIPGRPTGTNPEPTAGRDLLHEQNDQSARPVMGSGPAATRHPGMTSVQPTIAASFVRSTLAPQTSTPSRSPFAGL